MSVSAVDRDGDAGGVVTFVVGERNAITCCRAVCVLL